MEEQQRLAAMNQIVIRDSYYEGQDILPSASAGEDSKKSESSPIVGNTNSKGGEIVKFEMNSIERLRDRERQQSQALLKSSGKSPVRQRSPSNNLEAMVDGRYRSPEWRPNTNHVRFLSDHKPIDKAELKSLMLELINAQQSASMQERCRAIEVETMGLLSQEVSQALIEVLQERDEKTEVSKHVINACQYFEAATQTFTPSPVEDNEVLSLEILPTRVYVMTDSNKGRSVADDKSSSKLSFATSKFGDQHQPAPSKASKEQLSSPSGGLQETPKFERKRRTFRKEDREGVKVLAFNLDNQADLQIKKIQKEVNFQKSKDVSIFNSVVSVGDEKYVAPLARISKDQYQAVQTVPVEHEEDKEDLINYVFEDNPDSDGDEISRVTDSRRRQTEASEAAEMFRARRSAARRGPGSRVFESIAQRSSTSRFEQQSLLSAQMQPRTPRYVKESSGLVYEDNTPSPAGDSAQRSLSNTTMNKSNLETESLSPMRIKGIRASQPLLTLPQDCHSNASNLVSESGDWNSRRFRGLRSERSRGALSASNCGRSATSATFTAAACSTIRKDPTYEYFSMMLVSYKMKHQKNEQILRLRASTLWAKAVEQQKLDFTGYQDFFEKEIERIKVSQRKKKLAKSQVIDTDLRRSFTVRIDRELHIV